MEGCEHIVKNAPLGMTESVKSVYISQQDWDKLCEISEDYGVSHIVALRYLIEDEYERKIYYPPRIHREEVCDIRRDFPLSQIHSKMLKELCDRFHYSTTEVIRGLIDEEYERRHGKWKM